MPVRIQSFAMANPGDFSDFERQLRGLDRRRVRRLAVVGKTEGNADTNDYSRELAMLGARLAIERVGGEGLIRRATLLFSTGCEGAYTPFGYLLVSLEGDGRAGGARGPGRLSMGVATTRRLEAREVG
ncbi:MAG: ring-opening amidohydrolase, partial [Candidatus Rokuibacteriota bacterium]